VHYQNGGSGKVQRAEQCVQPRTAGKSADALRKIQKPPARRKKISAVVKIGYVVMVYEFVRKHIHMDHEGQHKGA